VRQEKRSRSSGQHVPRKSLEAMAKAKRSGETGNAVAERNNYNERNIDDYIPTAPPADDVEWYNARNMEHQPSTVTLTPSQPSTTTLVPSTPYTPANPVRRANSNTGMNRKHRFVQKNCFKTESCGPCGKRIKFGKVCFKCSECRAVCHPDCRERVPLPCVPTGSAQKTPSKAGLGRILADFTPYTSPMVPALIVYCLNEVEVRGLEEVGLYRISGSEREVKDLRDKFLAGRGCPNLSQVDVHVLCGTAKDFLRSLREPLIPNSMWSLFTQAADNPDMTDGESDLYQAISELPQPNRDTLAFLMLHLQKVSVSKACKMNVSNLAKILGPTVVGYSSHDPQPEEIMREVGVQASTMERLINLDADYWSSFLCQNEGQNLFRDSKYILSPETPEPSIFRTPLSDHTGFTPKRNSCVPKEGMNYRGVVHSDKIFASPVLN
jgi:Rac GTPase-activating protein 1